MIDIGFLLFINDSTFEGFLICTTPNLLGLLSRSLQVMVEVTDLVHRIPKHVPCGVQ